MNTTAAAITAVLALVAALLLFFTGRKSGKDAIENKVLKDAVEASDKRTDDVIRAGRASDAVRSDPDGLRKSDPFERR